MRIRSSLLTAVALALALVRTASGQETARITGRVVDASDKTPIPQVTVTVLGTQIGALTSDSGRFTLRNVPSGARTLNVRRIGYRSAAINIVSGTTDYEVLLSRDVLQLEQQVVTGVATTTSNKNAASYDPVVTAEQLQGAPATTIENALQGKVAGVQIDQNSGAPGGGLQVNIRGVTTINATSQPLYVIDGVIVSNETTASGLNALTNAGSQMGNGAPGNQDQSVNRIADINPNDIESLQVLEGAAASSIYGSRAAAGVIVITTKHGSVSKPEIDATQRFGTFNLEHELDLRHFTLGQAETMGENMVGMTKAQVDANYQACAGFCDFQKSLYGGGQLSNESDVTIRGGTGSTTYFLSGLTKYDNGAQINTGYNKQSARANVQQNLFGDAITLAANIAYTSSLTRRGVNGNDNYGISGYDVLSYTPSWFCMNCHVQGGGYVTNPFGTANAFEDANDIQTPEEVNRTILGGTLTWKLLTTRSQSLNVTAVGGADFANIRDQFYLPSNLQVDNILAEKGVSTVNNGYDRLSNYSVSLVHHWTPNQLIGATTSIGLTRDKESQYQSTNAGLGIVTGALSFTTAAVDNPFNQQIESNDLGYYGQEQLLLFSERLSLTGGLNAERSSNNGNINKYYVYPKIAASFRVFTGGDNELNLRFAYGQAGNLPNYELRYNTSILTNYAGIPSLRPSLIAGDPNIRPETNTTIETGADLTLFKGRASLNATVFQKRVTNLLLEESVLPSSGFDQAWTNGGQITNQGLELALNATPIIAGKFSWTTSETFTRIYDRVDNLPIPGFTAGFAFGFAPFGGYAIYPGASANAIYGYKTAAEAASGTLVQLGNASPADIIGFGQNLDYGPLHLHVLFDARVGQSVVNLTNQYADFAYLSAYLGGKVPFFGNLADTNATKARFKLVENGQTAYTEDASFVKLRELTLKYDLPSALTNFVGKGYLHRASLELTGRNLVTWTKYSGLDPEVSNFGTQQIGRGQDVTPYPPTRSYFVSLDLAF